MGSKRGKRQRLEAAVAGIRLRYGQQAIQPARKARPARAVPCLPTGFPALDKALGLGGVPRGQITELLAVPTAGMMTLALKMMVSAQAEHNLTAFIDLKRTFDPDYARRCELQLDKPRFLLVQPDTGRDALHIMETLVVSRSVGLMVVNAVTDWLNRPHQQPSMEAGLRQLGHSMAGSGSAVIFLTPLPINKSAVVEAYLQGGYALAGQSAVRLYMQKERWLSRGGDIRGYQGRVTVVKNRFAPPGRTASISIKFNGTVRGDGT